MSGVNAGTGTALGTRIQAAGHVAGDLAAAHRGADEGGVLAVEAVEHRLQVIGEDVVIIAGPGLTGPAEAAPV